ncbi:MAG: phosphatase PAP2 family protein [Acidobacteriota bacterium]
MRLGAESPDISIVHDPVIVAAGTGLLAALGIGPALVTGVRQLPAERQRTAWWLLVVGAAVVAVAGDHWSDGPAARFAFAFVIATLPGIVAFLAWRTVLASAVVSLVPLYFAIPALVEGRTLFVPATALDGVVPLEPVWTIVYGSLFAVVLLPLLIVRDDDLFRRAMKAYLTVIVIAYVGFLAYPTVGPRPAAVPGEGFLVWCLRLTYSLDVPYNCFPSLHVAHSFVSALACYRVHRKVGIAAVTWASLVAASTLFTKQHYAADVIAGALSAYFAYILFLRRHPRELIAESTRRQAPVLALGVVAFFGVVVAGVWVLYRAEMAGPLG